MAHKKGGGTSRNGRDSNGQRLGVKRYGAAGETKIKPGLNVDVGRDDTLFATMNGIVTFDIIHGQKRVNVLPAPVPAESQG